jgi:hypothetical protein
MTETKRLARCKMTDRFSNPCSNPAVVPDAEILICAKHLTRASALMAEIKAAAAKAGVRIATEP